MVEKSTEPVGSMGADAPLAILSKRSQHVSSYFKQFFAQVSNPPIDPIRERMVMSLFTRLGESLNILEETPEHTRQIHISQPVLTEKTFAKLQTWRMKVLQMLQLTVYLIQTGLRILKKQSTRFVRRPNKR